MYRTNAQSRAIEEAFLRYGIRYQLVGGTRFYQRREVKDALAYLRSCGRHGRRQLRADHQRAGACDRRADARAGADATRPRERGTSGRRSRPGAEGGSSTSRRGRGPPSRASPTSWRGCGRASGCCRCRSCSTPCWSNRAIARCSPTAPKRARSAGRTCSSCARSPRATTISRRRMPSTDCSRRPRSSPTRTRTRVRRTPSR